MKVSVHTLKPEPVHVEADLSPEELSLGGEEARFEGPIHVRVKLTRMQENVLAQGEARATARLECSRCLDEMSVDIGGTFQALYVPETGAYGQREGRRDLKWGDERVNFYTEGAIDLTDEIRQCLAIELPLKPLCRPACAGLCPQCGQNLNEARCTCKPEEDDSPWAALRGLIPPTDQS